MPLAPGTKLGPYEILSQLGRGGMGEVYRARDPRLNRDVAIKVSVEKFNPRFEREARAVAALNHPNICQIYDIGPDYIVMELVEGEEPRGPMSVRDTLKIARQIAAALEAAHEKGIVHRDLKPANIKIKADGTVKVLDFGLARLNEPEAVSQDNIPTGIVSATQAGTILGTPAYMSPEQARGKSVDNRADIWAFGVLVYELSTGDPLFSGESYPDILAHVLMKEPDLSRLDPQLRPLVAWCLEKDTARRLRNIADSRPSMEMALSDQPAPAQMPTAALRARWSWAWPVAGASLLAAAGLALLHFREQPPKPSDALHFQIRLPENVRFEPTGTVVMSPDGKHVVFPVRTPDGDRLAIQDFDGGHPRTMTGAPIGDATPPIFWSPDSRYVVFSSSGTKMSSVDITTGEVRDICTKPGPVVGGDWNDDGVIIFGTNGTGLYRVSANGGDPAELTKLDRAKGEVSHELPMFLPDGRTFLYLVTSPSPEVSGIFLRSLNDPPGAPSRLLVHAQFNARLVIDADKHGAWLLYLHSDRLLARRFDLKKLALTGPELVLPARVGTAFHTAFFFASPDALVYRTGGVQRLSRFVWVDAAGKDIQTVGEPGPIEMATLSPDETRVAYIRAEANGQRDVWVLDLARGTSTRVTFGNRTYDDPRWSPDGRELVFGGVVNGVEEIFRKRADGTGTETVVLKVPNQSVTPEDWSRDGRYLAIMKSATPSFTKPQIDVIPMMAGAPPIQVAGNAPFTSRSVRFSADGRYVAYESDESGRPEVYVQALFPEPGGTSKWLISSDSGKAPSFTHDGKRLTWAKEPDIWEADVDTAHGFHVSPPRRSYNFGTAISGAGVDGKGRTLLVRPDSVVAGDEPLEVIVNWQSALRAN